MKRPDGFDPNARKPPAPKAPPPGGRAEPRPRKPRGEPGLDTAAARPTRPPGESAARPGRPPGEGTARRSAAREARRAERIRKRYEKQELKRFTRRQRRRRIAWGSVAGIVVLLVALILVAVYSPILALRHIRVDGTNRLDPAVIAEAVSGQTGVPLALLDEDRIRRELGEFTLIRSYVTELVPPDTLLIHIVERAPIGAVSTPAGFDVLDPAGVVIESPGERPAGLPLLVLDDEGVEGIGFESMVEVLRALPSDVLAQLDTITARTRDDVTLVFAGSNQRVVWGSAEDSDRKARVLAALLPHFAASGPGEYDVSSPGVGVFRPD